MGPPPGPGPIFYPKYLDMTEDECARYLRQLELEAYAAVISALRAQGDLTKEKKSLLAEICACFGIGRDRYKAEIRRAVNEEKLSTIALHVSNSESNIEWIKEGRRLVPLPDRPLQITVYMEEADRVAEIIAKENAALPQSNASTVCFRSFEKKQRQEIQPPEKPPEAELQDRTRILRSSLYCAKCLSTQSDTADVGTTTEDLGRSDIVSADVQEMQSEMTDVPSASDSYVYLPGGTTVRVAMAKEKEEVDAYSMKSSSSGQIDFGNAPEISLTAPRSKRKRKKSVGTAPNKDNSVTIRQIIRPLPMKQNISSDKIVLNTKVENLDFDDRLPEFPEMRLKPEIIHRPKQSSSRKQVVQQVGEYDRRFDEPYTKKRKRSNFVKVRVREPPPPPPPTIQHTPVPPEHLYAAGSNTKLKHQRKGQQLTVEEDIAFASRSRPEYSVSTQQSPTKHIGQFTSRMSPLSPSYYPPPGTSPWSSSTASIVPRDITANSETITTYSRGFRYSPTKPFYKPPNVIQSAYGRAPKSQTKKYKQQSPSNFSFSKKAVQAEIEHQSILKRIAARKDIGRGQYRDPSLPYHSMEDPNALVLPVLESSKFDNLHRTIPPSHTSSLEELASVSLMASELSTSIVETGLAPVSAIVSRVSSPAPGQLSATEASAMKKSSKPMVVSRIQSEEGGSNQPLKIVHPTPGQLHGVSSSVGRPGSTFVNVLRESATTLTSSGIRLKSTGSIVSISGQHPATHQVRLALSANDNIVSSIPVSFTSAVLPAVSSPMIQSPRVISSVTGKPHTVLKSSSGNVITVTAKPLPGMKSSSSSLVSGASIVKPQLVQKTSIIVVHKAPGSKIGKTTPAGFPLGGEGSKVITVSTKNLSSSSVDLPRLPVETEDDNSTSTSALGSIQGLVSGLSPAGIVKKTKVIGTKPKFVTMPLHKKTVVSKIADPLKTKVIQNVIRAPGKVLVRTTSGSTLSSGQLRTFTGSRIVKPIITQQQQPSVAQVTPGQGQAITSGQDIVAAALSQSLGTSTILPTASVEPGAPTQTNFEASPSSSIIKVSTSTPAASTIKAFAANYQKTSTSQQKQMKPLPSVTAVSQSLQDKTKVYLATSPVQPKGKLFTPNQPQVHRSPQGSSIPVTPRPKSGFIQPVKTTNSPYITPIPSVPKPSAKIEQPKMIYHQTSQQSVMQVKVIGQQPSTARSHWQSVTTSSSAKQPLTKEMEESTSQTKILRDIFESTAPVQQPQPSTSDRATYIYQYHANPVPPDSVPASQTGVVPISLQSADPRDLITLHSVADVAQTVATVTNQPVTVGQSSVSVCLPGSITAHAMPQSTFLKKKVATFVTPVARESLEKMEDQELEGESKMSGDTDEKSTGSAVSRDGNAQVLDS
ncbi:uncharacterized protein LOC120340371 isoform X3 [Styela clava]